jgi:hypothetical protein
VVFTTFLSNWPRAYKKLIGATPVSCRRAVEQSRQRLLRYGFDEDRVHVRVEEVKSLVDPPKSAVDLRFRGRT